MTALSSYSTGTVTVASGGTTATGTGTIWSGTNVKPGDILQIGNFQSVISDVTDTTHLVIPPWGGGAQTGVAYTIWQVSPQRFAGAQAMQTVNELVAAFNTSGFFVFVDIDDTVPDPSLGDDGQYALQPTTGKTWSKSGGVWVYLGIYGGIWNNLRLAKSANYTLADVDKGKTVALGGNAFFTLTVSAASGYDTDFSVMIVNEDSTRGKIIAINGYSNFILWPQQSFILFNQNNVWQFNRPGPWIPTSTVTFYVNHASGAVLGATDGLATGAAAFSTVQAAIDTAQTSVQQGQGITVKIQLASETFTESVTTLGYKGNYQNGVGIQIVGDIATPTNVVWQVSGAGASALTVRDHGVINLQGVKFVGIGSNNIALNVSQFAVLDIANVNFGAFSGGTHLFLSSPCAINVFGSYAVSGSAAQHAFVSNGAMLQISGATITVSAGLTFSNWAQVQLGGGFQIYSSSFTGSGAGSGTTGKKYDVTYNAWAQLNGLTLPGATAGTNSTGGQVSP